MNKEMLVMMGVVSKLLSVVIMVALLVACGNSNQGTTGSQLNTPELNDEQTESPETFDLSEGTSASAGDMLSSGISPENIEYTMHDFLEYVIVDVDRFWVDVMIQHGLQEPNVYYVFPGPGESVYDVCRKGYTGELEAQYCPEDDTIVFTQEMAIEIWEGITKFNNHPNLPYNAGDFSVAVVVAHEYAHSLQAERGWFPKTGRIGTSRSIELNADCLAGIWAKSVYARGLLEEGDIEEAMRTLSDLANDIVINNKSHGLPAERTEAFVLGYTDGSANRCDKYLENEY